jgi:hypothetical protein
MTASRKLCAGFSATEPTCGCRDPEALRKIHGRDLSSTYRRQPNGDPFMWADQTPSIAQSGKTLEIKNEKGEVSNATLTSDATISAGAPFNSLGIIRTDHSMIGRTAPSGRSSRTASIGPRLKHRFAGQRLFTLWQRIDASWRRSAQQQGARAPRRAYRHLLSLTDQCGGAVRPDEPPG